MKKIVTLIIMLFSWAGFSQIISPPVEKGGAEPPVGNYANDSILIENVSNHKTLSGKTIRRFVAENYDFPTEALENEITGTILVEFIVEKDGTVQHSSYFQRSL